MRVEGGGSTWGHWGCRASGSLDHGRALLKDRAKRMWGLHATSDLCLGKVFCTSL